MSFLSSLFDDIGRKIKSTAEWCGKILLILGFLSGIVGFVIGVSEDFLLGLILLGSGIFSGLFSLAVCRLFYGFGHIIDLLEVANNNTFQIHKLINGEHSDTPAPKPAQPSSPTPVRKPTPISHSDSSRVIWVCKQCGEKHYSYTTNCKSCGANR